jgi:hypothetical protein
VPPCATTEALPSFAPLQEVLLVEIIAVKGEAGSYIVTESYLIQPFAETTDKI